MFSTIRKTPKSQQDFFFLYSAFLHQPQALTWYSCPGPTHLGWARPPP